MVENNYKQLWLWEYSLLWRPSSDYLSNFTATVTSSRSTSPCETVQSSQTYHTNVPPSPPLSVAQSSSRSNPSHTPHSPTTARSPVQVSSSLQTTANDWTTRINLHVTIVLEQEPSHGTRESPRRRSNVPSVMNGSHSPSPVPSDSYPRDNSSVISSAMMRSTNRSVTNHDIQAIMSRLEFLQRQAEHIVNGSLSASSRSSISSRASTSTLIDPRSPAGSTISNLVSLPPMNAELFFSPPRSPLSIPHAGSLSISTDSPPSSGTNTPSTSGSLTPVLLHPALAQAAVLLGAPGPSATPARVQRRPIVEGTECGICLDPIYHPVDAVWCRGTCGQNVHVECFDEWRSYQNANSLLCTYW